jgi:hypothetical protein
LMRRAADFFKALLNAPVPRVAVENPVMHGHAVRLTAKAFSRSTSGIRRANAPAFGCAICRRCGRRTSCRSPRAGIGTTKRRADRIS